MPICGWRNFIVGQVRLVTCLEQQGDSKWKVGDHCAVRYVSSAQQVMKRDPMKHSALDRFESMHCTCIMIGHDGRKDIVLRII